MTLQAGTGVVDITPLKPMFLVGYPHVDRISQGAHDPLYATALCLKSGGTSLILVSVDILFIEKSTAARCRAAISEATGVPVENIVITATHTHSGPVTFEYLSMSADPVLPKPDPEYMTQFEAGITVAATTAWRDTKAALLATTTAYVEGVGCNRLSPEAVRDPAAGILYVVDAAERKPLAVLMAYAMHPTVLHEDSLLVSSDFPHFTRAVIKKNFPGATVLYHTAPGGNLSPRYHVKGQTFAEAERLGARLGEIVCEALSKLEAAAFESAPVLGAASKLVDLPVRKFPAVGESERLLTAAVETFERLKREGAAHGPVRTAECVVFGAEERVVLSRTQDEGGLAPWLARALPAEVQALRIGETNVVALPGELFVEYGLEVKRRLSGQTVVFSLANGELQGYIVTPEADAAGGYEAACSMFTAEAGRILVEAAITAAESLRE
ncbi:MAG: hypothetical protein GX230_05850 [Lentisphaerae bacterium]|jgi:hypothetical protein|nr:hypothetical protein [Lentisphaerota bacterium]